MSAQEMTRQCWICEFGLDREIWKFMVWMWLNIASEWVSFLKVSDNRSKTSMI